jgi:hypothetical protein
MGSLTTGVTLGSRHEDPFGSRSKPRHVAGGNSGSLAAGRRATLLALSMVLLGAGCSSQPPTPPEVARPVKTVVVAAGGDAHVRTFPGKVET